MPEPIISIRNLGKRYRIGKREANYLTLRDAVSDLAMAPLRRLRSALASDEPSEDADDHIWALRDVSLDIQPGEVVGIIGRNGAGKTTLLKILSRITEPTEGCVGMNGRVASLLEVGTGFHPELTGRENVFLNGAILGMRRHEITAKFDEIVAFAEIEKFMDTPVKRYSSGMYVRLAFAVAAHLEPEILLVDEVLAVGDTSFQQKCMDRMSEVAGLGRTVVLVSHNMSTIYDLSQRAIWLDEGEIVDDGPPRRVIDAYRSSQSRRPDLLSTVVERPQAQPDSQRFQFGRVEMLNERGEQASAFAHGETLVLLVDMYGEPGTEKYIAEFYIYNQLDQLVAIGSSGAFHGVYFDRGVKRIRMGIGPLTLTAGRYSISLSTCTEASTMSREDTWDRACHFTVECQPFRPGRSISSSHEGVCVLQQSFAEAE